MSVEAINRGQRLVLMVGGRTWPISTFLDTDGEECDSEAATFAVVGPCKDDFRDEFWVTLELSDFEEVQLH